MSRDDLNNQDQLNDYLDSVATGWDVSPVNIDPETHDKVQRLFALADAADSPAGLSQRIWENMMSHSTTAGRYSVDQPARWSEQIRNRPWRAPKSPTGWTPSAPENVRGRVASGAFAVMLLLGLVVGYVAYGPLPQWAERSGSGPAIIAPFGPEDSYPMIGAWRMDQDVSSPGKDFVYVIFHSDGTVVETEPTGDVYLGLWAPNGENSIAMEVYSQNMNPPAGTEPSRSTLTATFVYDAAANSFTGTYTYVMKTMGGSPLATFGGDSVGQRLIMSGTDATPTP